MVPPAIRFRPAARVWLALALLGAGCRQIYDTSPQPEVFEAQYIVAGDDTEEPAASGGWWTFFEEPALDALVAEGLQGNFDLRAAQQRLIQAEAIARRAGAERLPELGLDARAGVEFDDGGERAESVVAGVSGRWAIDVSSALKLRAEARGYSLLAAEDELELARLNLSAAIAESFVDCVAQDLLAELLEAQEANALAYLQVVEARFDEGIVGRLDVLQQEGLVAEIRTQMPVVRSQRFRAGLRLDALLGRVPGSAAYAGKSGGFPQATSRPAIGSPLALLATRPDLRAFRHDLIASDADAARAMAERWPQLALDFDLFWREGTGVSEGIVSLAAGLFQPLFDAGRRREDANLAVAQREERRALFSSAFLGAVADVEEGVFSEDRQRELVQNLERRRNLLTQAEKQATDRYAQGLTDFLPVITARQELLTIEQRLVRERRNLVLLRIGLFAALGGPMG